MVRQLRHVADSARDLIPTVVGAVNFPTVYLKWARDAHRLLTGFVAKRDADRLIRTPLFWALIGTDNSNRGSGLRALLEQECLDRIEDLDVAAGWVNSQSSAWEGGRVLAGILDTNVVLDVYEDLAAFGWNGKFDDWPETPVALAIPMVVLDEVDNLKNRGERGVRERARGAIKMLDELLPRGVGWGVVDTTGQRGRLALTVLVDPLDHVPLPIPDNEVVQRALGVAPFAKDTIVFSNDLRLRFTARQNGLKAATMYRGERSPEAIPEV